MRVTVPIPKKCKTCPAYEPRCMSSRTKKASFCRKYNQFVMWVAEKCSWAKSDVK